MAIAVSLVLVGACTGSNADADGTIVETPPPPASVAKATNVPASYLPARSASQVVTFIELGSVNCVPCQAMQPVMDSLRAKYSEQVQVLFYDVWTDGGKPYGRAFGVRVIPTQVFLDAEGKEYFRHEGFFALEEVLETLERGGLKP